MIADYESELTCDLAEVYGIYDYHKVPAKLLMTLTEGLGPNSRVGMKITGVKAPLNTILLARIFDDFQDLLYSFSEDAKTGANKPKHFTDTLLGIEQKKEVEGYATGEEFEKARAKILKNKKG